MIALPLKPRIRRAATVAIFAAMAALCTTGASAQKLPPPPHPPVAFDTNVRTWVVPALRKWTQDTGPGAGSLRLKPGLRIVYPGQSAELRAIATVFADQLHELTRLDAIVVAGAARSGDIVLALGKAADHPDAYALTVSDRVEVRAASATAVRLGTQSVLHLLKRADGMQSLPRGQANDWPEQAKRMMFVDIGRKYYRVSELDDLMRQMAWLKLNTLGLHFNDWPAFRLRSPRFPGLADRLSYDRADVDHLQRTARRYGITIIPEIDLPAHATALIQYRPSLAFDCESMRQSEWLTRSAHERAKSLAWTVDITKAENRAFMQSILREFIPWFEGEYVHIGGDEYQYDADKTRCPELVAYAKEKGLQYPGDVFVDWINETNRFVKSMGKKTAIWNWWRFKDDKTSIQPDTDILIYVWNSPRLNDILASGYKVIVAPEDKLYVVPGIENWDGSGYGMVDTTDAYLRMPFLRGPNIKGYMLALWSDAAESSTDRLMLARAYEPMAVVAERSWAGAASPTLDQFLDRLNESGSAPGPGPIR